MKKYNILFSLMSFKELTGSELYVYELCKNLKKDEFNIHICAYNVGGVLTDLAIKNGFNVYHIESIPKGINFDIIHCQHAPVTKKIMSLFPKIPKVCTIHSEIYDIENPLINHSIKKYICIRPEIQKKLINKFSIPVELTEVIYNPIDEDRFNMDNINNDGYYLFVGTIHDTRKMAIFDMIKKSKEENKELWIVGKNHSNFLNEIIKNNHVKYFNDTVNVEKFVKNCYQTSGILMGRTTIEGWMCGKSGWIYDVDTNGNIISSKLHEVPLDVDKFKSSVVSTKIKEKYTEILNMVI